MVFPWQNMMIVLARSESLAGRMQSNSRISSAANQFVGGLDEDAALRTALELRQFAMSDDEYFLHDVVRIA